MHFGVENLDEITKDRFHSRTPKKFIKTRILIVSLIIMYYFQTGQTYQYMMPLINKNPLNFPEKILLELSENERVQKISR